MNFLTDNPALYERAFPDPDHAAATFVDGVARRFGAPGRRLLDLGCGTGRDAGHLATMGYSAVGLDTSAAMLDYARSRHPAVHFVQGRMQDLHLDARFDVITSLDSALLYCHHNDELATTLAACHRHLTPGGLFVAEMRNAAFFLGNDELLRDESERSIEDGGVTYRARTRLWIDHAQQLLRRRRSWSHGPVQESAWRLLFPQELSYFLTVAGFEVLALFDEPGPRTDLPWRDNAPAHTPLRGDRLHVVARITP